MQRRACDQCYSRRKRCLTRPDCSRCARCEKTSIGCTNARLRPRAGRPPKQGRGLPAAAKTSLSTWDSTLPAQSKPTSIEFYHHHDIYMIGSTFATDFQRALDYCHQHSAHLLDDISLACASSLSWARFGLLPADQVDVRRGAASVAKLRNAVIAHTHDALAVLMLGQALAAFDTLVSSRATISILRYSLSLARPWYPGILRNRLLEPIAIAPIFWDTIWCLLHREIPVIRPDGVREGVVDRVVGLCASLLPILYDLCVVSYDLASSPSQSQSQYHHQSLEAIEHRIQTWNPSSSITPSQEKTYTPLETLSMNTQASMYRTASLLLIHHLRRTSNPNQHQYPDSNPDTKAHSLATQILIARATFFTLAGRNAKLQNTSFPLLLALLEIPVSTDGLWESSTWLRHRPACVERLFEFVDCFWQRKRGTKIRNDISLTGMGLPLVGILCLSSGLPSRSVVGLGLDIQFKSYLNPTYNLV
ncbi:hypothetical protein BJX76DRAFT_351690 [Aspergillus varians]